MFVKPLLDLAPGTNKYILEMYVGDNVYEELNNRYNVFLVMQDVDTIDYIRTLISNRENNYYVTDYSVDKMTVLVMEVPDQFKDDFQKLKLGKYSEVGFIAKKRILDLIPSSLVYVPYYNNITAKEFFTKVLYADHDMRSYLYERLKSDTIGTMRSFNRELINQIEKLTEFYPRFNPLEDYLEHEGLEETLIFKNEYSTEWI